MTKEELQEILNRERILTDSYDLDGGLLSERLTLARRGDRWAVYYSERGVESGYREFYTESEACEYLLSVLRNDPTTKG